MANHLISNASKELLLHNTPFFSNWNENEITELAQLLEEIHVYKDTTVIAEENELIDAIYFIAEGSAEVTQQIEVEGKTGTSFITLLNPGDNIGLKESGLFSDSGARTATVTAHKSSVLLKLELKKFHVFMQQHPQMTASMDKSLKDVATMQWIKNAAPFSKLSNIQIARLAEHCKELYLQEQEIIFTEGDTAESCYMVCEGCVEILKHDTSGAEKNIAYLEPGALFGEAALLNLNRRNATARAYTACMLVELNARVINEFITEDADSGEAIMSLIMPRAQPIRINGIIYSQRRLADGVLIVLLKNPLQNTYYQLNQSGWHIWQLLDGNSNIAQITEKIQHKFPYITFEDVERKVNDLIQNGFVSVDAMIDKEWAFQKEKSALPIDKKSFFIKNPDKKASFLYRYGGFLLFYPPIAVASILFGLAGFYFFYQSRNAMASFLDTITFMPLQLVCAFVFVQFLKIINPLFKILAIKHYQYEIPSLGLIWNTFGGSLVIDQSDLLMASNWPRIAVALTGMGAYAGLAFILSLYVFLYNSDRASFFLWISSLILYLELLRCLNPFLDLEGYHILQECLNTYHLRDIALKRISRKYKKQMPLNLKSFGFFWSYALLYLLVLIGTTNAIISIFIPALPWITSPYFISTGIVTTGFLIQFILEMKQQKHYPFIAALPTSREKV